MLVYSNRRWKCWAMVLTASLARGADNGRLEFSTYLGGSLGDYVSDLRVDPDGGMWVAGVTASSDFPVILEEVAGRDRHVAFVLKLTPDGAAVLSHRSFPSETWSGPRFGLDGSVLRFQGMLIEKRDPTGAKVLAVGRVGGSVSAVTAGRDGSVYVAGTAGPEFRPTPGAAQERFGGGTCYATRREFPCPDVFVAKLSPDLTRVVYATFLGGSNQERVAALAVDSAGNAVVAGETISPDFPATAGAMQRTFRGVVTIGPLWYGDVFLTKLDATGQRRLFSTYLGGNGADVPIALELDRSGNVYVGGGTQSIDFPTTQAAFQRTYGGPVGGPPGSYDDGFAASFDPLGQVRYSTLAGGLANEAVTAMGVGPDGMVYIDMAPGAVRLATSFPIRCDTPQPNMSRLDAAGAKLETFRGKTGDWPLTVLRADERGILYAAGTTRTLVYHATPGSLQYRYGGGDADGFVAKMNPSAPEGPEVTCVANAASLIPGLATQFPLGHIAPGEIISIFGSRIGGGAVKVRFDGIAAPLLYAAEQQINAVVPFGVEGPLTNLVVEREGRLLGPHELPVSDVAPGIFSMDGTGSGQAAVLNEDGTINSTSNPAARGSVISIYATGIGRMEPPQRDGEATGLQPPFPLPRAKVNVLIGGSLAEVLYAGAAPGLVAGAAQVNARVPENARPGRPTPITVQVGTQPGQPGLWIAVR